MVELPVQRRLCPIFVRDVGSPCIHDRFRWLTGSQRTPGIRGIRFMGHLVSRRMEQFACPCFICIFDIALLFILQL